MVVVIWVGGYDGKRRWVEKERHIGERERGRIKNDKRKNI